MVETELMRGRRGPYGASKTGLSYFSRSCFSLRKHTPGLPRSTQMVLSSPGTETCPMANKSRRLPSSFFEDYSWDSPQFTGRRGRTDPQKSNEKSAKQSSSPCKRASDDQPRPEAERSEVGASSKHKVYSGDGEGAQAAMIRTRRPGPVGVQLSRAATGLRARRSRRVRIGDESEEESGDGGPAAGDGGGDHCTKKDDRPPSPLSFLEAFRLVCKKSSKEVDFGEKDILDIAVEKGLTFGRSIC